MTGNKRVVRSVGKTLEEALVKAAVKLGVDQKKLAYEVSSQRTTLPAFFLGRRVEIQAWFKEDRGRSKTFQSRQREVASDRKDLSNTEKKELKTELATFCQGVAELMTGEQVEVLTTEERDGRLVLDIKNDYLCQQIGRNTKLAEAMEHIIRKKPTHLRQELPFRIFVDVQGTRRAREDDLVQMAQDLSIKVSENQRPIVLNYKSSYDRKIIHMTLDKNDKVYTKSIGT